MKCEFRIKGLDCANCAAELERIIDRIEGVDQVIISFLSEKMIIELEESNKEKILQEVETVIKKEEPDVTIQEI